MFIRWAVIQFDSVLIQREHLDTDTHRGRRVCEDEGRDQADEPTSQGGTRITREAGAMGQARDTSALQASEGTDPADSQISDFQSPEL